MKEIIDQAILEVGLIIAGVLAVQLVGLAAIVWWVAR